MLLLAKVALGLLALNLPQAHFTKSLYKRADWALRVMIRLALMVLALEDPNQQEAKKKLVCWSEILKNRRPPVYAAAASSEQLYGPTGEVAWP